MELAIYEDHLYRNFLPLAYLRAVFDLRCGIFSCRQRVTRLYPGVPLHLFLRDYLTGIQEQDSNLNDPEALEDGALFLNGRALLSEGLIPLEGDEVVYLSGDEIVGFRLTERLGRFELIPPFGPDLLNELREQLPKQRVEVRVPSYPWDLVSLNSSAIAQDFELLGESGVEGEVHPKAVVEGQEENLRVGMGSRIEPNVFLNLEKGPIYIGDDVVIRPPSIIDGPCHIGNGALIDGAQLRRGCSIGKVCKVSGELERSIFHGFCNKHHFGFIGHSYLGEWVNLGAGTTNSDLKNNYSSVRVRLGQDEIETGRISVGCFIGDHSKTGIGTLIDTGSMIGVFCNIFGGKQVTPKFVPSFFWGDGESFSEHKLEKAIETAKVVMARRGEELPDAYRELIEEVYGLTSEERGWGSQPSG